MNEKEIKDSVQSQTPESQPDVQVDNVQSAPQQTVTLNVEDFKSVIQSTVESVLKANRSEEFRQQAAEYNAKVAEVVKNSQATLMKPSDGSVFDINYIENVFKEDDRKRRQHPEGKALYGETGEDFLKAKIILLKKIGLTNEEILREIKTISV